MGSSPRMRGSPGAGFDSIRAVGIIPAHAGLTPGAICYACAPWDHPRACGAHLMSNKQKKVVKGSSPRMRGSLTVVVAAAYDEGIIPAHAGLTAIRRAGQPERRDHPRACGAHVFNSPADIGGWGSSPRMRGSLSELSKWRMVRRIIPAHAGLTPRRSRGRRRIGDHPRACGAHHVAHSFYLIWMGSSPRMRGSLSVQLAGGIVAGSSPRMRGSPTKRRRSMRPMGIIPAHAGLTRPRSWMIACLRDHPRACGAHFQHLPQSRHVIGSSPRMRGSQLVKESAHKYDGIIPAHAGLTSNRHRPACWIWDHPRACGAHFSLACTRHRMVGSSPRMRGSPSRGCTREQFSGIIPAHAGLTVTATRLHASMRDHPRACGAHRRRSRSRMVPSGSSPRMRGSPRSSLTSPRSVGIIPAHAGLTLPKFLELLLSGDHPRACGAHFPLLRALRYFVGSSPRMRGSPPEHLLAPGLDGIIPAHAGLTSGRLPASASTRDHPRACGAHTSARNSFFLNKGSSPRMRGSQPQRLEVAVMGGIIPAHAGLTSTIFG